MKRRNSWRTITITIIPWPNQLRQIPKLTISWRFAYHILSRERSTFSKKKKNQFSTSFHVTHNVVSRTFNKHFPPVPRMFPPTTPLVGVAAIVAVKNALVLVIVHERSLPVRLASSGRGPQAQIAETGRDTFAGLRRTLRASSPSGRLDSRLYRGGRGNGVQAKGHVYTVQPPFVYIYT